MEFEFHCEGGILQFTAPDLRWAVTVFVGKGHTHMHAEQAALHPEGQITISWPKCHVSGDRKMCRKAGPPPAYSPQRLRGKKSIFQKERIKMESRQKMPWLPPSPKMMLMKMQCLCNESALLRPMITDDRKTQPLVAEVQTPVAKFVMSMDLTA